MCVFLLCENFMATLMSVASKYDYAQHDDYGAGRVILLLEMQKFPK